MFNYWYSCEDDHFTPKQGGLDFNGYLMWKYYASGKKFLPNLNVCDACPRNYVMTLVPTFEDNGSALENFKGVAGHQQTIRTMKPVNMWRTWSKDVQGS